ncbi:glyoxalase superfamily protein [Brevundimonas bacteroides]|uniref:glyoxalase superfamily protein n=1 Tax=Brevundimonas bacteroides TaxID=74311 RepID=UPI00068BF794|nr:glyoxalase superfamily protein [Brevundimonas bacteroides]
MSVTFGRTTPILRVADQARALAYYTDILGFSREWGDEYSSSVRRGEATIMLATGDQGQGEAWLYLGVDDVDALHDEIAPKGAIVRTGPANYPWGARELHVEDTEGNVIRFGSDATGEPDGDWIDTDGARWIYTSECRWQPTH